MKKRDPLFEPIHIGKMECKNRIYMPAMHLNMTDELKVTPRIVEFYATRARGGAGTICAGYATVDEMSGGHGNIGAHSDEFLEGLALLSAGIRDNGANAVLQLNHAGRYNSSFFLEGKKPVAPSAIASRLTGEEPRELTAEEIQQIIVRFAEAADRVKRSGFDAVEILSGTGYLISEFLSPITNKRTDEWGGSFENRIRFGVEIVKKVRKTVGDFPIIVRINGNEFMPGGTSPEQIQDYAEALCDAGTDALCVNVGWHEARVPQIVTEVPRGAFAYLARGIKERTGVPVIASHRINEPRLASELIDEGSCDMVAMGRALIADPRLPAKALAGKSQEIIHCVACAQGCFDNLFKLQALECLCNPMAGYETTRKIEPAAEKKSVLVIGGGPAGMAAAIAASDRGHQVTLYEKAERLGGQLHLAGAPPGRGEFIQLATDLGQQLKARAVEVVMNRAVDDEILSQKSPDHVIIATGAKPILPDIPGVNLPHVVQAWDVLGSVERTGHNVVVLGGGAVGVETALFLAEKGTLSGDVLKFLLVQRAEDPERLYKLATRGTKRVTIVEMLPKLGTDIGRSTRWAMLKALKTLGIKTRTETKVTGINEKSIQIEKKGKAESIDADSVVLAVGAVPLNPLAKVVAAKNIPYDMVGDAAEIKRAFDAIHNGFMAGRQI